MIKINKLGKILEPTNFGFETKAVLNPAVYQDDHNIHIIYRAIDDNFNSSLGYARLEDPLKVVERFDHPYLAPKFKEEKCGIEDPRIVKIDDTFYLTYVVHDGKNALTSYSYGTDLMNLTRGRIISPKISYKDAGKIFHYSKLKDEYLSLCCFLKKR